MPITTKATYSQWNTAPVDGGTSEMQLTRGALMHGLMLSIIGYTFNVTVAGLAVRTRSVPVKEVSIIGPDNDVLFSAKGVDLIAKALIFEQTPAGALLTPAPGFAIANYTGLEAHIPIHFQQPHAGNGVLSSLPSWAFKALTLRVKWGQATDLLTGAPTGTITFPTNSCTVTQLEAGGVSFGTPAQARAYARSRLLSVDRFTEVQQAAVAATELELKIGNTSDIRAIMITAEGSNGEPIDTVINSVTLKENNRVSVYAGMPWKALKADNAKIFGLVMPTGVGVIDFAEDGDISDIYRGRMKDSVSLFFNTNAVAANIRAHLMTLAPSPLT